MNKFESLKNKILSIIPRSPVSSDLIHAQLVLKWTLVLRPDADEALQIAALGHDIDRAVTGITDKDLKDPSKYEDFRREHSIRSAKILSDLMKQEGYDERTIDRVYVIVEKHEFGGDPDSDALKDADSIAYFEYNIPTYLERYGREKTKNKIKFMYKRMSKKAEHLVKQLKFGDKEIANLVNESISEL